jgi:hypothetical protein
VDTMGQRAPPRSVTWMEIGRSLREVGRATNDSMAGLRLMNADRSSNPLG